MEVIKADIEAIKRLKSALLEQWNEMESSLQKMYESVDRLNDVWEGPNHDRFVKTFEEQYKSMKRFNETIKTFAQNIGRAAYYYEKCEDDVKKLCGTKN